MKSQPVGNSHLRQDSRLWGTRIFFASGDGCHLESKQRSEMVTVCSSLPHLRWWRSSSPSRSSSGRPEPPPPSLSSSPPLFRGHPGSPRRGESVPDPRSAVASGRWSRGCRGWHRGVCHPQRAPLQSRGLVLNLTGSSQESSLKSMTDHCSSRASATERPRSGPDSSRCPPGLRVADVAGGCGGAVLWVGVWESDYHQGRLRAAGLSC